MGGSHFIRRLFSTRVLLVSIASLAAVLTVADVRDLSSTVSLSADAQRSAQNIGGGDRSTANGGSVTASVWLDADADGLYGKSEAGVANALVSLMSCDGSFVSSSLTDAAGNATFGRVAQGCYRLRYNEMTGYRYCPTDTNGSNSFDSDASPTTGLTESFEITKAFEAFNRYAGVIAVSDSEIGDRVWEDANANGFQDIGEQGIAGVQVNLLDCSGDAVVNAQGQAISAVSEADGSFLFGTMTAGCYRLGFEAPNDHAFSSSQTPFESYDSDADPVSGITNSVNITGVAAQLNLDAGLYRTARIGDWVWHDLDGNGVQSDNEQGVANVKVILLHANGVPSGEIALTDADGYYSFDNVAPGSYKLQFASPDGFVFSQYSETADVNLDSDVNGLGVTAAFNVTSGANIQDKDVAVRQFDGPRIGLEKLTNGEDADLPTGPFVPVGTEVIWEYVLTNLGNQPFTNIQVTDDQGVSVTCPQDTLDVGETITCTGSTDDAQSGQYMNNGTACGIAPSGLTWCDKDDSHYFGSDPSITIEKLTNGQDSDEAPGELIVPGSDVMWEYIVTNTGNVTLNNVVVTDDQGVVVSCPSMTLDPGVSMTCIGMGTAIGGQYANLGSVTGEPPVGGPVADTDPSHYFGPSASIDIEKSTNGVDADSPTGPAVLVGDTVTWTYTVTNTGSITLNDVVVTDNDPAVTVSCPSTTLAPGASFDCTATGIATAGQYDNQSVATGQGVDSNGDPVGDPVSDDDPSHYFGAEPSISIEKATNGEDADTPTGPTLTEGDDVNWTYVVTNTGNVALENVVVTDDQGVTVSCPQDTLAIGESFTCTASGTATVGQYMNLGTVVATGLDPNNEPLPAGPPITDDDPSHYIGEPQPTASLGDKVFKDLNANGQQDADEPGIPGITVNLWTDDDGNGTPDTQIATTTTDGDGMYGFADLDPDLTYVVQFVNDPAMNMPFTTPNVGNDASDSDAGPDGITGPIDLDPGENNPTIDAGVVNLPASLGDKVFKDLNSNGQQDADEPGIPGITVNLWTDDDGDGSPDTQIATTTTDANGMYGFTDLDPTLVYVVQFVNDPAMNMPFTSPNVGDDASDSDAGDGGITGPITLTSGQNDPTIDAGLVNLPASLGDKVFKDLNSNGQQDADEPGIPGITVNLWTDDDGDGSPDTQIATTTTDANGMYGFADLDPTLVYVVQFVNDPAMNMPFTTPNTGDDASDSDAGPDGITGPITLTSGQNDPTIDAGLVNVTAGLGDKVFKDLNNNGQQDADEPGVPGITVNLWTDDDGDGSPDTQINTTTTDAAGMYSFTDLDPTLVYVVQFINDPAMNMPFTTPNVGNDATDSDAGAGGITGPINLGSGEFNPTIDAGIVNLPASLGDKVFKDLNSNGQQDADEPGVPGITVNLWTDDNGDGSPDTQIATTTTDANGMYGFADLDPALTYVVQFVNDPAMNMPFTTPNVGDDASDSDAGDGGITGPINLGSGENNPTIDAGIVNLPASLGDKVFKDLNGNGQQDADEPGIPGITVNLWTDDDGDGSPDTQIATTTTDANGMYGFADLDPTLVYVVQFVNDPAMNMPFTTPNTGDDASDSDAGPDGITGPITLTSGQNNPTIDAGLVNLPASLGDKVFKDLNSNGQQDADEPGIPGITVNLWTDDDGDGSPDTQIATTTTDANGMYGFADLDPTLVYVVQFVNDPAMNMPFTTPNTGDDASDSDAGPDGITGPITLTSGQNDLTIDAGLVNQVASLGDKVFKDLNSDGQQDAGEPGVPGITVNLWTDDDGDGSPDTQIATTTTDANGMYSFTDLDPALTYVVQFVNDPAMNMPFTTANVGNDASDSDAGVGGITGPINLASGENNPTIDAGIVNLPASLGDRVFKDLNGNGQQDAGEPGVEGITVNLWTDDNGDGSPDTQIGTTTTDANGLYGYTNLDPTLTYVVQFVNDPAMNMPFTTANVGNDASDSDAGVGGITGPINLASGENNPTIDAGIVNLPASLGDKVFKDLNGNGQQDADEPGVPGITVNLWTDDDGDGSPDTQIATTTTDANGMYGFADLDPTLVYVVQFVNDPAMNMPFTTPNVGDDSSDSDAGPDGITGPITLTSGQNNTTIDAGLVNSPASLGDKVFKDLNSDGQQDVGEPGVPGITVNLWTDDDGDGSPDTQIATTTTDANGMYGFTDLDPALTYVVQFVNDPAMNMPFTTANVGNDASDSDAGPDGITGPINLGPGENDPTIDAGLVNVTGQCVPGYVADHFNHVSYDNNDGDMNWLTPWMESDPQGGGAHSGNVMIDNGQLVLHDYPNSGTHPSAKRSVDLSDYPSAMLMYDWSTSDEVNDNDSAVLEISTDGGNTYTVLRTYTGLDGWNGGSEVIDISAFISANTTIRFRINDYYGAQWDKFMVDNVRIDKKCDEECVPGFVKDHFSHVSYNNNDGDMDWEGPWHEYDPRGGGAHSGNVMIDGGQLIMNDYPNSGTHPEIRRTVDLSDYNSAMLSFDWSISEEANENDHVALWISSDGGHTWHQLDTFKGVEHETTTGSEMYDISAFISDQTVISFQISNNFGAVWDKFMVNFVRVDKKCDNPGSGPQVCVSPVTDTPQHGVYLPNFVTNGEIDRYSFEAGAQIDRRADGTATLTGIVFKQGQPDYRYELNVELSGGTFTAPPGSPKNNFGYDTSDWYFYPNWNGTLTGLSWNTGAHVSITRTGPAFQVGTGANDHAGEGDQYGGSGWLNWTANSQPNHCEYYNDCVNHEGSGDINVRIEACPL